ncbi:hypothetical protein ACFQ9V_01705 [Leifsonia sp. NPDC056665]|uniref:hypothetical protein n=1 Tax=Leifsonia sp. NPDC056665 TaxID=3345901 RepID=UPI00369244D8
MPAISLAVASPAYATSSAAAALAFNGVPASASAGTSITGASISASDNPGADVTVTVSPGLAWSDGTVSPLRVIGSGPGVYLIPDVTVGTPSPGYPTGIGASSADASAWAPITVLAGVYEMTVLGAMDIIARGPDEYRADYAVIVPRGVRPAQLKYRFEPDLPTSAIGTMLKPVTGDIRKYIDQNYAIVHVQDLGNGNERLFLSCRGDAHVKPATPTATYSWPLQATWPNGTQSVVTFPILVQRRGADGRPVAINAWDKTTAGLTGYDKTLSSQAAWGNLVRANSSGTLNGNHFHVDALASGRSAVAGNDQTTEVYYQFVHEDGTPASVTPTPKRVVIPTHSADTSVKGVLLGSPDQLGTAFELDKPGYWRLLCWPQANNSKPGVGVAPAGVAWDPQSDPGHQIGSVFWKLPATGG